MPEELKQIWISVVIFTIFIVGGISIMSLFMSDNPGMIPANDFSEFNNSFNTYADLNSQVGSLDNGVRDTNSTDPGQFGVLNGLINSAWQTLRTTTVSMHFIYSTLGAIPLMFPVPVWFMTLVGLIITITVVYAIWGAIFQR